MYRHLTEVGSLLECFAKCYFDDGCKILVYENSTCFLGEPLYNGTIISGQSSNIVYGNYGLTSILNFLTKLARNPLYQFILGFILRMS